VLDGGGSPAFTLAAGEIEFFPAGGIADENGVDGVGAMAAELFVEGIVADGVGVTEDGEGRSVMVFAELSEVGELFASFGEDEGGSESEANVVELPAGNGDQLHADGVFAFVGGGGGRENGEVLNSRVVTDGATDGLWGGRIFVSH